MNRLTLIRFLVTLTLTVIAVVLVFMRYRLYFENPWTRDGMVRARIVEIAPQVTGPLITVAAADSQLVRQGELLFEIEDGPYRLALQQIEADLREKEALENRARAVVTRAEQAFRKNEAETEAQTLREARQGLAAAQAAVVAAQAAAQRARLQLEFTKIRAPQDGYIVNLTALPGTLAVANKPLVALVAADTFRVDAFFRETLIRDIQPGAQALVTLMAYPDTPLEGEVVSVGRGIARKDGSTGPDLLPVVSPTFEWIRLAQRIPVRVHLRNLPPDVELRVGMTASVLIRAGSHGQKISDSASPALPTAFQ